MSLFFSNLEKRLTGIQKKIAPLATKLEQNKYLASIKSGIKDLTFILLVGSFFLIFHILLQYMQNKTGWFEGTSFNFFHLPVQLTFGMLSLYTALSVAYRHAKKINAPLIPSVFASMFTVSIAVGGISADGINIESFSSNGLLIALLVTLLTVEWLNRFVSINIREKVKAIPEGSVLTFQIVTPIALLSIVLYMVNYVVMRFTEQATLVQWFYSKLFWGIDSIDTPVMVFIIVFLEMLFWFVGINGYAVLAGFVLPFATYYLGENVSAVLSGSQPEYIFTPNFWDYFASLSGSGLVGALVILALFSKVQSIRSVGKVAFIPSIFSISEPILYGLPITFNIYLFIPFVIGTPILATLQWFVFKWGFVNVPVVHMADAPTPIAQVLSTMDWRAIILVMGVYIAAILMYYPFFKLYEKSILSEEQNKDDKYDELDLDF